MKLFTYHPLSFVFVLTIRLNLNISKKAYCIELSSVHTLSCYVGIRFLKTLEIETIRVLFTHVLQIWGRLYAARDSVK